ncbi:hypothetical protein EBH_0084290 [Eimeria brunetti]|uniref:Transmembrane protein n=1 Tax=Eimeria brunetti TaxID=51314 RepID=U6LHE3_9EIME|nr:hypothetical protein EBH_0084290 [Eimeria brunetti]
MCVSHSTRMDPHPHAILGDVLLSSDKIKKEVLSNSDGKQKLKCDDPAACVQHRLHRGFPDPHSVRLVSVAFISLAIVYFLLRCFELTAGRYRVAPVARSLAADGGRKCHGYGDDQEAEEDGGDAEAEDIWIVGAGETDGVYHAEEDLSESSIWQTGDTTPWRSMPAADTSLGFRGVHGVAAGTGHATAAAGMGESAELLEHGNDSELGTQYSVSGETPQPYPQERSGGSDGSQRMEAGIKLLEGETLDMWERRNIPNYAKERLARVFGYMMRAVAVCRPLLPLLNQRERLILSHEVMRLLTMELGAFSLVPQDVEHLRLSLGKALVVLGTEALESGATGKRTKGRRNKIEALIALVDKLKEPRPRSDKQSANQYRKKMITILQTSAHVMKYLLGVLDGLWQHAHASRLPLSREDFDRQADIIEGLYEVHASQIIKDLAMRHFILSCQNRIHQRPIFDAQQVKASAGSMLPPLARMLAEIENVVTTNGGILPRPLTEQGQHGASVATASEPQYARHISPSNTEG